MKLPMKFLIRAENFNLGLDLDHYICRIILEFVCDAHEGGPVT